MRPLRLRSEVLRWREIDRELVAVDLASSMYLSANESGRVLWRRLAEGTTREELVRALMEGFGIGEERAGADVDGFLQELEARNLLET